MIAALVKELYDIRSSVVHGSKLSDEKRDWLIENCGQVELRVRQVLVAAVQELPADEQERRVALARLYDPTDQDRGEFAVQTCQEIKTAAVRKSVAAKIAGLVGE